MLICPKRLANCWLAKFQTPAFIVEQLRIWKLLHEQRWILIITLTVFWWTIDHVELVNFFGVVLGLCVILPATLLPVSPELLNELPGAVVEGQDLKRYLARTCCLRRTGHPEFTQDLSPDSLHSLFLYVVDVHGGASGKRESHCHTTWEEKKQKCFAQIHISLWIHSQPKSLSSKEGERKKTATQNSDLIRIPFYTFI